MFEDHPVWSSDGGAEENKDNGFSRICALPLSLLSNRMGPSRVVAKKTGRPEAQSECVIRPEIITGRSGSNPAVELECAATAIPDWAPSAIRFDPQPIVGRCPGRAAIRAAGDFSNPDGTSTLPHRRSTFNSLEAFDSTPHRQQEMMVETCRRGGRELNKAF